MSVRGPLSHLDLNVSNPAASIRFYGLVLEYLGYTRHDMDDPDRCYWSVAIPGGGEFSIEIRPPAAVAPRDRHERYSPGIDHLAFHASSRADVDGMAHMLESAGIAVADQPTEYDYTPGYYATAFDDPDGIRIEVVHEPLANP